MNGRWSILCQPKANGLAAPQKKNKYSTNVASQHNTLYYNLQLAEWEQSCFFLMNVTSLGHHLFVTVQLPIYFYWTLTQTQYCYSEGNYMGRQLWERHKLLWAWWSGFAPKMTTFTDAGVSITTHLQPTYIVSIFNVSCLSLHFNLYLTYQCSFLFCFRSHVHTASSHLMVILLEPFGKGQVGCSI